MPGPNPPDREADLEADVEDHTFADVSAPGRRITRTNYERVRLQRCVLTGAIFDGCQLEEVVFDQCELTTTSFVNTRFRDVQFVGCRMMGINWTNVQTPLYRVSFRQCRMDNSTFSGMKLKGLVSQDCSMVGVDLSGCDLSNTRFPGCDLSGALIRQSTLHLADFTDSRGAFVDVRTCKLRGTRVGLDVVAGLVKELGLSCPELDALVR